MADGGLVLTLAVAGSSVVAVVVVLAAPLRTLPNSPFWCGCQRLGRAVPQRTVAGANLYLVLCIAQDHPGDATDSWLCARGAGVGLTPARIAEQADPGAAQRPALWAWPWALPRHKPSRCDSAHGGVRIIFPPLTRIQHEPAEELFGGVGGVHSGVDLSTSPRWGEETSPIVVYIAVYSVCRTAFAVNRV